MLALLNPRVWLALGLAAVLAFTNLYSYRSGRHAVQQKWDAAKVVAERAAQEQQARNLDLQRHAERNYVVQRDGQDRFFVETVKEIRDAPLPACPPLPDPIRLRVNAAIDCADGDSPAACGPASGVPQASEAAGAGDAK